MRQHLESTIVKDPSKTYEVSYSESLLRSLTYRQSVSEDKCEIAYFKNCWHTKVLHRVAEEDVRVSLRLHSRSTCFLS